MRWKKPKTEEAWEEYLSAYIDGELSRDEIIGLEDLLKKNPDRKAQMESLKSTSGFLKKWVIDAPMPDAAFIRNVRKQAWVKDKSTFLSWFKTLRLQTILPSFIVGLFVGVIFMSVYAKESKTYITDTMVSRHVSSEHTLSQRQAEELFKEVDAEGLKAKVLDELKNQNIDAALETYHKLKSKYPESRALRDLNENRKMRFFLS